MDTESVQVLYDANHWVTSALVAGSVMLADRINQAITPGLVRQLRQLYAPVLTSAGRLHVNVLPCQKQAGGSACGLFAAAYAFDLASGSDSLDCLYGSENEMRAHLKMCLDAEALIPFPKKANKKRGERRSLACVCCDNVRTLRRELS